MDATEFGIQFNSLLKVRDCCFKKSAIAFSRLMQTQEEELVRFRTLGAHIDELHVLIRT